jgi:hypothetical protein
MLYKSNDLLKGSGPSSRDRWETLLLGERKPMQIKINYNIDYLGAMFQCKKREQWRDVSCATVLGTFQNNPERVQASTIKRVRRTPQIEPKNTVKLFTPAFGDFLAF